MPESKLDVLNVLDVLELTHYITEERTKSKTYIFTVSDMMEKKMIIETRQRYPSDKLFFTIADITKNKPIRCLNIFFNSNEQYDVYVVLENSQRNLLNSFI